jgi:hypothetical protein
MRALPGYPATRSKTAFHTRNGAPHQAKRQSNFSLLREKVPFERKTTGSGGTSHIPKTLSALLNGSPCASATALYVSAPL